MYVCMLSQASKESFRGALSDEHVVVCNRETHRIVVWRWERYERDIWAA